MRRTIRYSVTHTQARALVHDLPNSHDNSILIRPFRGFRRERRVGHACNLKDWGKKINSFGKYIVWMEKDFVESIPGIIPRTCFEKRE